MKLLRFSSCLIPFAVLAVPLSAQTNVFPASGNVGIGTANPTWPLQIGPDLVLTGAWPTIGFNTYYDGANIRLLTSESGSYIQQNYANDGFAVFSIPAGDAGVVASAVLLGLFQQSATGNVGIGTGNPISKLDVKTAADQHLVIEPGTIRGGADGIGVTSLNDANNAYKNLVLAGSTILLNAIGGGLGNVGIGTTNPLSKLHVMGVGRFGLNDAGTNNIGGILVASGTGVGGARQYWIGASNPTSHNNNMFQISDYNGAIDYPLLTIFGAHAGSAAGNVGIGTTNPSHKLSVNGTVRAKEVIVDTGWADYVFKKGYRLASLTEVEAHIEREGHLPGIPSAAEVAEHGVSMGEMQAKLLAKVEELTLHVIAQEKELTAQRATLETQAAEIASLKSENFNSGR